MTNFKLEIPYPIFNSDKVNENEQDELITLLIDNNFDGVSLDFDGEGNLEFLLCYGDLWDREHVWELAHDLLKLLITNDYLDLDLIKEHYKDDYLVSVYPIDVEAIYSAGLEQLEEE